MSASRTRQIRPFDMPIVRADSAVQITRATVCPLVQKRVVATAFRAAKQTGEQVATHPAGVLRP